MESSIVLQPFSQICLEDPFFNSLKADYPGFEAWFAKKSQNDARAYVLYGEDNLLQAFLHLKIEDEALLDIVPHLPPAKRLKVATFKIDAHNTKLGERFIKKIMDAALYAKVSEIYVTIFPKHTGLIRLLSRYGFHPIGSKGQEQVLLKDMQRMSGNQLEDFPLINPNQSRKFLLSIRPEYHTRLFPDSMLFNEQKEKFELVRDVSHTNSIHKVYISFIKDTAQLIPGDLLVIYRTSDQQGLARFRSVATSICQVEEVKRKTDFTTFEDFLRYTLPHSVFTQEELAEYYKKPHCVVIKMTYNIAFPRRITKGTLVSQLGFAPNDYWGFRPLTDIQFHNLLQAAQVNESSIIH